MCGCNAHQSQTNVVPQPGREVLSLRVEDMTCGHCAAAISKAIETGLPGTQVAVDPASKLVSVRGGTDIAAIKALVIKAGYTPSTV
ncbi:heavy-metal-associated domain-containing protein [Chelatococcus daeguensis]|uniref:Copper chaperone CopZ n=2 Tax=Chelatococcaceae TaxID=2036754 RepID=A0ABP2A765_9HYPH|nr:heavy-metal-associated domain-containing protein [Chelatococcus daeguensis]CUA86053.1 Copper chaperone CopZ [Chelatococcus sambhunathii]